MLVSAAIFTVTNLAAFVTAEADFSFENTTLNRLAFGSCHKNKYQDTVNWNSIAATDPQLFLWTGDAVYPPTRRVVPLPMLKDEYDKTKLLTSYGKVMAPPLGIFGTWDDHDYGANDIGGTMPDKSARADLYFEFLEQSRPPHDGIYYSIVVGSPPRQVKILLLDTRWFREEYCIPSFATKFPLAAGIACLTRWLSAGLLARLCNPDKSILGEQQWEWLTSELQEPSSSQIHIVVSSIQVTTTNPVMESWGHFPKERQRLLHLLSKVPNPIILSGDVHYGEVLPNLEITSSALTHDCSHHIYGVLCEPLLKLFGSESYFIGPNFGTLEIDWEGKTYTVSVRNMTGHAVLSRTHPIRPEPMNQEHSVRPLMNNHLVPVFGMAVSMVLLTLCCLLYLSWTRKRKRLSDQDRNKKTR